MHTTPTLRFWMLADAAGSGATGLLLVLAAGALAPWLGLPETLLRVAGALFLPWAALVAWVGLRAANPPRLVGAIVALNLVYVVDCVLFAAVARPWFGVAPTGLGMAFLLAQAGAVLAFSLGQWAGMRRGRGGLATSP
ncbi:MAG TPA: hypothetical protein VGN96_02795 [Roseococcus sp.]|jgi:hypothetical protein|nr:hypothetical protein [Roseococcus sp.]